MDIVIISAFVSATITMLINYFKITYSASVIYRYEEKREIRKFVVRHHGYLVRYTSNMSYRLFNMYSNKNRCWLDVGKKYSSNNYYYNSTLYRFMCVIACIYQVDQESLIMNTKVAEKKDLLFLNYSEAIHWVMTDTALFEGLDYNNYEQSCHFFSDKLREYGALCVNEDKVVSMDIFLKHINHESGIGPVLDYFDGIELDENNFKWDRLVVLHLILLAFLNEYGYRRHRSDDKVFLEVAGKINNIQVLTNFVEWIPKLDFNNNKEIRKIMCAYEKLPRVKRI
ncbi:hypothetical protein [Cobetia marina]|uniref:hypothetical protein n=1 Tax=Cobetia marina TaxID=28258 RepID=UPI003A954FF5